MAPDISLDNQRAAQYVYSSHVEIKLAEIKGRKASGKAVEVEVAEAH